TGVSANEFSFTAGSSTRRGTGAFTITEAGVFTPKGTFTFKRKSYHGSLTVTREKGRWLYVNQVPMDEYLTSVVSHEMSPSWNKEALKAQAVVARTYL
ncbi:MAG TPA: SpoIID/LytB domain-containing protein, partial [Turneriella sp.]|nr:SpoIID/LytB domain-containing protein [Turneriella sp.]